MQPAAAAIPKPATMDKHSLAKALAQAKLDLEAVTHQHNKEVKQLQEALHRSTAEGAEEVERLKQEIVELKSKAQQDKAGKSAHVEAAGPTEDQAGRTADVEAAGATQDTKVTW